MTPPRERYNWAVLNQSQSPAFQRMLEQLSSELGRCLVYTGMPHPIGSGDIVIKVGPSYDRRSLARRALSWGLFGVATFARVIWLQGMPFLFVATNPPFLPQVAWLLHKLRKFPYGLLMWDIYPDHMVKKGWLKEGGGGFRLWSALNRRAMLDARVVLTLGHGMAGALQAQLGRGADRPRIEVMPNWADTDELRPMVKAENPFAVEHGQVGKITVLYSGNMGSTHGLGVLVDAASQLVREPNISFLLIGDGLGKQEIEQKVAAYHLKNVELLPLQPWEMLPYSLASGDISIVIQAPGSEHLSLPSKTYSLLAAGCAIVACTQPESDLAKLVEGHQVGIVCPQEDGYALAEAIRTLAGDLRQLSECQARARMVAVECYSTQVVFARLRDVLASAMLESTDP